MLYIIGYILLLLQVGGQCMPRYNNCNCIDVFLQQISAKIVQPMHHTVIYNQPEYQLNVSQLTDFLIITLITKNIKDQFIHEIIYEIKLLNDNLVGWMDKKFGHVSEICRVLQEKTMYEIVKQTGIIRFHLPDEQFPAPYVLKLNKKSERVTEIQSKHRQEGFESMEIQTKNNQLNMIDQRNYKDIKNKWSNQSNSNLKSNLKKKYHGYEVLPTPQLIQSEYDEKNNPFEQKQVNVQPQKKSSNREIKNLHDKQYTPKYSITCKRKSINQNQKNNQIIENKNIKNIINTQNPFHIEQRARKQQQKRTLRSHKRHITNPLQEQQQIRIVNKKQRDQNQIKKLRRQNRQLKEEMKLMRTQMQQIKATMLNQQSQMYRIQYLEKMLQDMHYANTKKNYPNQLNIFEPYPQQTINFEPTYQDIQLDKITKSKCRNQWRISQITKTNEDFQIQGLKVTYNRENTVKNNWSYIYLQNVINPNKIFTLNIMVHKCLDQHIAFGIAYEKHTSKNSSWNQRDCYQYVGFSKMIFEGGKKKFQSGGGIWEGTNFTMIVNIKQGMIQWRSQRGSEACLQSLKLKNAKDRYVPFVRMRDRGDCIQFMGRP